MSRPRTVDDAAILEAARACVIESGPGVALAVIARRVGLSASALIQRFGSKQHLVFRSLLPPGPPAYVALLANDPSGDALQVVATLLVRTVAEFERVGPALAALRMSSSEVSSVFPSDRTAPPVKARQDLAAWLQRAHAAGQLSCRAPQDVADLLLGAAEARGFFRWVGPHLVDGGNDVAWARAAVSSALPSPAATPRPQ